MPDKNVNLVSFPSLTVPPAPPVNLPGKTVGAWPPKYADFVTPGWMEKISADMAKEKTEKEEAIAREKHRLWLHDDLSEINKQIVGLKGRRVRSEEHGDELRRMPDGPFAPLGFRYKTKEAKNLTSGEHKLLVLLWDKKKARPLSACNKREVMNKLYPVRYQYQLGRLRTLRCGLNKKLKLLRLKVAVPPKSDLIHLRAV